MPTTDQQKIIEIRVRYDQAVQGIAKYTQAINQLKTEQQQLKAELKQGTITGQQYNIAMAQNREQVKTYQADIRALSREFQNNVKEQRENEGSLVSLRSQLSRLTATYDQLSREMRQGDFGETMRKQIMEVSQELKEAEAETNRFYRNVGNYASGFNGLNVSVQQILREMPNAAMSMNTFFLAISNNIPMLVDEINRLREANKAAAAEGQATTSIWKALSGAFFSWNTVISVGVTLLTVYGGEIVKWIGSLFKAKEEVNALRQEQEALNAEMANARAEGAKEVAQLQVLYAMTQNTNASMQDRIAAVKQLQSQYPAYFGNLSQEAILAGEASAAYQQLTNDIMAAAYARAYQDRIDKLAAENVKEYLGSLADFGYMQNNRKAYEAAQKYLNSEQAKEDRRNLQRARAGWTADYEAVERYKNNLRIIQEYNTREERWKEHNIAYQRNENKMLLYKTEILKNQSALMKTTQGSSYTNTGTRANTGRATSNIMGEETIDMEKQQERQLEEARKAQDLLTELVKDSYEQRRKQVSQEYDRQIEDVRKKLNTEKNLTLEEMVYLNSQAESLEELKNRELKKLSDEQLQQGIANEQQRIGYLLQAAGGNLQKQRELKMQQLEQEQAEAELRLQTEIEDEAKRNEMLLALRAAFNQRRLDLDKEYDKLEEDEREKAAAEALKIEQAKWGGAAKLTNAASQLIRNFGEENKAMTALAKTLALATVAINTGKAISEAIAANAGKPWGFAAIAGVVAQILSAMATATSIINSAKFATGGLVTGPGTGTSDSIPARLSNGESVMTARTTSMFAPLLSSLNQLGGGVPITTAAPTQELGMDYLAAAVAKGMESMPRPVVSVEEISRVGNRVEVIERMGRV